MRRDTDFSVASVRYIVDAFPADVRIYSYLLVMMRWYDDLEVRSRYAYTVDNLVYTDDVMV